MGRIPLPVSGAVLAALYLSDLLKDLYAVTTELPI